MSPISRKPRRPFAWLRRLLLLALVVVLAGVAALFLFGRAGKRQRQPAVDQEATKADAGTTLLGQDFDYTYTEGERPIFRIRGDSIRADRQDTIFLDRVGLTLYDPEKRPYHVESREASFSRSTNEGELRGSVHLEGPSGLVLKTAVLELHDKGNLVVTPRPVQIGIGEEYISWAQHLTVHLPDQLFVLEGETNVATAPGIEPAMSLTADRAVYQRAQRILRVEGGAEFQRGADDFKADRITASISPDEKSLLFLRAFWKVSGKTRQTAQNQGKALLRFHGEDLAVLMAPGGREAQKVAIEGDAKGPAVVESIGGGLTRSLTARRVEGEMAGGQLTGADAIDRVEMRETGSGGALARRATGDRAHATFRPDGQIGTLALDRAVTYTDPQLAVTGDRGQMNLDSGQGEFFGTPVVVKSEKGQLTGPHIVYTRNDGTMHADGGVHAEIEHVEKTSLAGSPLGEGEGPVRVEAREGFWRESPRSFLFRGDVRAWRGTNLLTAKELRGDDAQSRLTATGNVKTLWIPTAVQSTAPAGGQPAKAGPAGRSGPGSAASPQQPVEVTGNDLVYLQAKGLLTYTGDVRVVQEERTLTCQQLDVQLDENKKAETMTCTGQAHLVDPQNGRNIEGQKALYHLKERIVEMFGDPVNMRDRDNNQLHGRHMVYHMEDGRVEVKGEAAAASGGGG